MNILSILARLETALGCSNLTEHMVLIAPKKAANYPAADAPVARDLSTQDLHFVVGYNGSPQSQTALDLTLWIAHQTRLATHKQVTVQVVYVVDLNNECGQRSRQKVRVGLTGEREMGGYRQNLSLTRSAGAIAELPASSHLLMTEQTCQFNQFEQADQILWQARHLAEEWRGSLETHLRFGQVAEELRIVVETEAATLLVLGCESAENAIVQQLGSDFPCPVLGIPSVL